jgi:hypothetical protein
MNWPFVAALSLTMVLSQAEAAPTKPAHPAVAAPSCCHVPAGTLVRVELVAPVGTQTNKTGDTFALRLAQPLVVNGQIVLPAGTPGLGEVVDASKPGFGSKAAKLVLAARSLTHDGRQIKLRGLQMAAVGKGASREADAAGVAGMAFAPLGLAALAMKGGQVTVPAGAQANAKLGEDIVLRALGPAGPGVASAAPAPAALSAGAIAVPRPAAGKGQIVFFRKKSLMGTGQWFNVRENGQALGKLTNGAYFFLTVDPGRHVFTASTEPQSKDSLRLEVDPGETYFVEGALTKGVVIGAANLAPSSRAAFDAASKELAAASAPGE